MLDGRIIIEPQIMRSFRPQGYRKLSSAETPTQEAVFIGSVSRTPKPRGYETPEAELFRVKGFGKQDGIYHVETSHADDVLNAYVSEARKLTQPLPEPIQNREATYYYKGIKIPPKRQSNRLKPDAPLYGTLEAGVRRQHPRDALIIK